LADVRLLEEPIAAFYAWIAEHRRSVAAELQIDRGSRIALVCDVGGGTTDFSLIACRVRDGAPSFERVAIGDHLLLGGDNVDLALARRSSACILESRPGARLAITQRSAPQPSLAVTPKRRMLRARSPRSRVDPAARNRPIAHRRRPGGRPVARRCRAHAGGLPADRAAGRSGEPARPARRAARARTALRDRSGDHQAPSPRFWPARRRACRTIRPCRSPSTGAGWFVPIWCSSTAASSSPVAARNG